MEVLMVTALILMLLSIVVTVLMLSDIEIQKKRFRRYVKQIEEVGRIEKSVGWWDMKSAMFVRSGWWYVLPDPDKRPDLYSYPELREIRGIVLKNWKIIPWVALTGALSGLVFIMSL